MRAVRVTEREDDTRARLTDSVSAMTEPWDGPTTPEPPPPPYQQGARYPSPPPQSYAGYYGPPVPFRNGLGVASLLTAIIAIFPGILTCVLGLPLGITAVAIGFAARRRVKRGEANNGRTAVAGITLGFVAIVASVVFISISYPLVRDLYDYYECTSHSHSKGHPECDWAPQR